MMDPTVNLISSQPSSGRAFAVKADSSDKPSVAAKTGEENKGRETSSTELEIGKNVDTNTLDNLQKEFNRFFSDKSETVFKLAIDPDTKKSVFSLVDKETKEIIQQFPPEEILAFAKHVIALLDEQAEADSNAKAVTVEKQVQEQGGGNSLSISV